MNTPVENVISRLQRGGFDPRQDGHGRWKSRCPAHNGGSHNLSIAEGRDGAVLLKCHHADHHGGTCTAADVVAAIGLGMSDLFPPWDALGGNGAPKEVAPKKAGKVWDSAEAAFKWIAGKEGGELVAVWTYLSADGTSELMKVGRINLPTPDGEKTKKKFLPAHPAGGGWRVCDPPAPLPIFNLDQVATGPNAVFVAEGEKCADLVAGMGFTATTSPHGADGAKKSDWTPLAGRTVYLLPDRDRAGAGYVNAVGAILAKLDPVPTIKVVDLGLTGDGDDIEQWLAARPAGETARARYVAFERLMESAKAWEPPPDAPKGGGSPRGGARAAGYILGRSGDPVSCASNSKLWLEANRPAGHIRYDSFRRTILLGGEPLTDRAVVDLTLEIESSTGTAWVQDHVRAAILHLAHRDEFSSLAEYLESLEWDSEPRIERFLADHFGVESTPYHQEVGRVFFLSAVARALKPGCKVDTVPLLIGPQGRGKSKSVAALCPEPDWFADELGGDIGSRSAAEGLQGKWLIELAELSALRKSDLEATKAFISRRIDHYRPPYGRLAADFPRTAVFVATTNDDAPLQDLENRRFLPVRLGIDPVDVCGIVAARDQLWAEAVHRFKKGEKWWTTSSNLVEEVRQQGWTARASDAWESILAAELETVDRVTVPEAAQRLRIEMFRLGKSEQTRIGNALRAIGFVSRRDPRPPRERYYERDPVQP